MKIKNREKSPSKKGYRVSSIIFRSTKESKKKKKQNDEEKISEAATIVT